MNWLLDQAMRFVRLPFYISPRQHARFRRQFAEAVEAWGDYTPDADFDDLAFRRHCNEALEQSRERQS